MPYVKKEDRDTLDQGIPARTKGELNYKVTQEAIRFIDMRHNAFGEKVGYGLISEAIAALRDAADEMQRRLLAPYEERMIAKNGDCYPEWLLDLIFPKPEEHEPFWEDRREFQGVNADKALAYRAEELVNPKKVFEEAKGKLMDREIFRKTTNL